MSTALLRTKLHPPFTRLNLVSRPRLKEQVVLGLRGPLTLITAPAGFGKSTLAASCTIDCEMPVAWLSLDKDDNAQGRFLNYVIAAVQEVDQTIGSEAAQLLAAAGQAPFDAVLTSFINDLVTADGAIALVLDDYQSISSQTVHEAVTFLLEHCPSNFHLVIVTRSDPPLPITRWRVRGQMVELRADDLRFTGPEAAQFLNDVMGLHLDTGSIAALEERTDGWITGLQMAALSLRDRKDRTEFIEGFSGTNRYILDYLLEEVLASESPELHEFLLRTSILERLTAPLCDALLTKSEISEDGDGGVLNVESLSIHPSASVLAYLERENLFLLPLDDERIWYRYHHLFADILRARLHQAQPNLVPLLHIQASVWLEQNGFIPEAIPHLFAAHEIDRAADLIEGYGPARLAERDPSVLQMAESLPQETILARPKIGLYLAWLLISQGRIAVALPLLHGLAQKLASARPNSEQRWMQAVVDSALAFLAPQSSIAGSDPLPEYVSLEAIPADELILRNAADFLFGMALGRRGNLDGAVEVSLKSIQRERNSYGKQAIPTLAPFLTRIYLIQGRLQAAAALCREFLDPIKEGGIRFIHTAGSMKIDLGEVLYEWNRLDEAEQYIRDGLHDNEPWQNIMTDCFGLIALARVQQAKGEYTGAMRVVEKFEKRLHTHSRPREFDEDLRTLRVRVQLASGDLQTASNWAEQILLSEDFKQHKELYRITFGRIRLAEGRYAEVEQLLAGITPPVVAGSQVSRQIEANMILAAAIAGQRRMQEALRLVETSLALAEPEGTIQIFLDVGESARDLLAAYIRTGAQRHEPYAQNLLDAFSHRDQGAPPDPQKAGLIEPLTEREMEVLKLIAMGRTNKAIAQQLFIAPGTVKAHTASIYRKLDVANRTEAAARAKQLGVLT